MLNYKKFTKDQKMEFWSEHFKKWKKSELSHKKYCEHEQLSYWSFRTWYYKSKPEAAETKFIKVNSYRPEEKSALKIRIILGDKIRIELDENISDDVLRRIFKASEVLND